MVSGFLRRIGLAGFKRSKSCLMRCAGRNPAMIPGCKARAELAGRLGKRTSQLGSAAGSVLVLVALGVR